MLQARFTHALMLAALTLTADVGAAHPSVSVVRDSRGNIYYSDLKQVWRLSPDGKKTIAVPGVHTHELYVDAADNLFGEHLWYNGEALDTWGHYVWRRSASGRIERVIPARAGFLTNYSFVRDSKGVMYWADRDAKVIRRRLPTGAIALHASGGLRDVRWMTARPDGTLLLVDGDAVKQVAPSGQIITLARGLRELDLLDLIPLGPSHNIQGIWSDNHLNVYIAVTGGRVVKRIDRRGKVSRAAVSRAPWSPTGGMVGPNGDLWIQEVAGPLVRLRHLDGKGRETFYK